MPVGLAAGEAFQFDWSEDWAELTKVPATRRVVGKSAKGIIAGERTKLQMAHTKLSHSRVFIVRAYLLQTHEMLFDALAHTFGCWAEPPEGSGDA